MGTGSANEGAGNATFPVTLTRAVAATVSFQYSTTAVSARGDSIGCGAGPATNPTDFVTQTGTGGTIPQGATSGTVTVPICNDTLDEPNQTFTITLSNAVNASVGGNPGTQTILDDDTISTRLSISSSFGLAEGISAQTITPRLSAPTGHNIVVRFATGPGAAPTATGGASCGGIADFVSTTATTSATVTIPGEQGLLTGGSIQIPICNDPRDEFTESFRVTASANFVINSAESEGTVFISDDDPIPLLRFDATASNTEGNDQFRLLLFNASLSNPSEKGVTFDVTSSNGSAVGGANCDSGVDFRTPTLSHTMPVPTAAFPAGGNKTVAVATCPDIRPESDETFALTVGNINANANPASKPEPLRGIGTIRNDDEGLGNPCQPSPCTGQSALTPSEASAPPGGTTTFDFSWIVPDGAIWRSLEWMELRLRDEHGIGFWLRWNDLPNTFQLRDPATSALIGSGVHPGEGAALTSSLARVDLRHTRVTETGLLGRMVTLTLPIEVLPAAANRTFTVEVAAKGDANSSGDPFSELGTLAVSAPSSGALAFSPESACGGTIAAPLFGPPATHTISVPGADGVQLAGTSLPRYAKFTSQGSTGTLTLTPDLLDGLFGIFGSQEAVISATGSGATADCRLSLKVTLFGSI
jgi:hypothetical protein